MLKFVIFCIRNNKNIVIVSKKNQEQSQLNFLTFQVVAVTTNLFVFFNIYRSYFVFTLSEFYFAQLLLFEFLFERSPVYKKHFWWFSFNLCVLFLSWFDFDFLAYESSPFSNQYWSTISFRYRYVSLLLKCMIQVEISSFFFFFFFLFFECLGNCRNPRNCLKYQVQVDLKTKTLKNGVSWEKFFKKNLRVLFLFISHHFW